MKIASLTLRILLCPLALSGAAAVAQDSSALPDAPSTVAHEVAPPSPTGPMVVFDTSMGRMVCELFDKEAPATSANFIGLANGTKPFTDPITLKKVSGTAYFDGTIFHRVIPGFMIQGGDRLGTGAGDAGYYIALETAPGLRFDVPGRLAMAHADDPNSNSAQFFITEAPQSELDGHYTIFGQCDAQAVALVAAIARVPRDPNDKPLTDVKLNKVTIVAAGQPLPPDPHPPAPAASAPQTPASPQ